jgi:hypothetical protein|tara:strand:+ start:186 stop:1625 length:1440 start_codon:yes stop_codon:yes gene_type:complete
MTQKKPADNISISKFLQRITKLGGVSVSDAYDGGDTVDIYFDGKLTSAKQNKISSDVYAKLTENFDGTYELKKFKYDDGETILGIKVSKSGVAGAVPTDIQEEGSAFVMTRVLTNNKKFSKSADIFTDSETRKGLEKIFGSTYKEKIQEWTHSYFEHQKAFFAKFQPSQWDVFEHGGQDLMSFIQTQCQAVTTDTGEKVGNYTTWNPADIWVVKNKAQVVKDIDQAIQKNGTAKLVELNNVLLKMMKDNRLIGLSLKKVKDNQSASFKYVNMSTKKMEFASVEEVEFNDIKFEIDVTTNVDGMQQGGYVLFGNYTINVIRTPTSNDSFSNLKFESVIKGSGGRGGAAPVDLVSRMLSGNNISFKNRHQDYPTNASEFNNDRRNYARMYSFLRSKIDMKNDRGYENFKDTILSMYRSGNSKKKAVAQSKLMQLVFFYECLNSSKGKKAEFWTDLFYLSIKRNVSVIGNRFAPHGKLDVKQ